MRCKVKMMKEIKKGDIPDWSYGDVVIKTYSYGDLLSIKDMANFNGEEVQPKDGFKESDVGLTLLAAGIHFIRNVDGTDFIIKPHTPTNDKKKFCFDFEMEPTFKLLTEIKTLNNPLSEQEKKL
jgi:hypothetical protein